MIYAKGKKSFEGGFYGFKKFAIISMASLLGIVSALYLAFLFILPAVMDINKFTPLIDTELKKYAGFDFSLTEPKLETTWRLGVKVKAKNVALKYSDGKDFVSLTEPSLEINLPTLLFKRLNLDKIYAKKISGLVIFDKNKKYTFEDYIIEQTPPQEESQETESAPGELPVDIRNINIIVDEAVLTFVDENISKTYAFSANDTKISLNSLKGPLKIKTSGDIKLLGSNSKSFLDFDINLITALPKGGIEEKQITPPEAEKFAAFNPFENLETFKAYSKIFVDLKIDDLEDSKAKGIVKISDTTIINLPKSNAEFEFNGNDIKLDSNLYIAANEYLKANGNIKTGKKPKIDLHAKTEHISLENIKQLSGVILSVLNIKNEVKDITTTGYITCDFDVKSDMKTINSKGQLSLRDGSIKYPKQNLSLSQIGAMLDFNDNRLVIKNTSALVNGAKFSVAGEILTNSKLNLDINSDPIKIADLITLGTQLRAINPQDIADFVFNAGSVIIKIALKGNLQNIEPTANVEVQRLTMRVKSLGLPLNMDKILIAVRPDKKDFIMDINVANITGGMAAPKFNLKVPTIKMSGNSKTLTITPTDAWLDQSRLKVTGKIDDYMTNNPAFAFTGTGTIHPTSILMQFSSKEQKLIKYAGVMPIEGTFSGDFNNMKFTSKITSSPVNYVSVVDIENLKGHTNTLNMDMNIKGTDLVINDMSISSKGSRVAGIKGNLGKIDTTNPTISNLSITLPQKLFISAPTFGISKVGVNADLSVSGSAQKPVITGSASITDLSYPGYKLTMGGANIDFKKSSIVASAGNIKVGKSDFSGNLEMLSDFSKGIIINTLNFNSNFFDSDELMQLTANAPNTQVTPGPTTQNASGTGGLVIKSGKGVISKIKSGTLYAENISFDYNMYNDLFKLTNLNASAYDGLIKGDASYHLAQLKAGLDVSASGLNMGKFAQAMSGIIIPVTGTLDGVAQLSFIGVTFEQQMRTLSGSTKFNIRNGELKEFIRLENFLYAGNILTQNIFGFNLNSVISTISKSNTGEFRTLDGVINFGGGWADVQSFKSQGPNMSMFTSGRYNLLTNTMDLKVLGRISPKVANVLGPLGSFSVNTLLEKLPPVGQSILGTVKLVAPQNPLVMEISQSELAKIPELSPKSEGETKEFQVILNGPATKTTSVKSFKWAGRPDTTPQSSAPANTNQVSAPTLQTTPASQNSIKDAAKDIIKDTAGQAIQKVIPKIPILTPQGSVD